MIAGCLDEATVLAFLDARLPPADRAEVETHLASCGSCADLTTWTAADIVNRNHESLGHGRPFLDELAPGARVGQYQILGVVGRGGMGEVYAAYHPELDRRIALKVVYEAGADTEERRTRLLREARAIARLTHPNVVTVYDAGVSGDLVFIAMEFVEGQTLDAWLGAAPRSAPQILDVFIAAGRGLAAAHAAQIVHRDFKPQNVMIGEDGSVRVMDFGLARLVHDDFPPIAAGDAIADEAAPAGSADAKGAAGARPRVRAPVTKAGALLGTPAYMAPEQFRREKTTARSDQFSFCVALHEALYGTRPTLAHLQQSGASSSPTTGESKPQRRGSTPLWLRNVVLRGLSTDPTQRWESMEDLVGALARDPARNRRRWSMAALAAAALGAAGVSFGLGLSSSHPTSALCQAGPKHLADTWAGAAASGGQARREALRTAFLATGAAGAGDTWARVASRLDRYAAGWLQMYRESCEATHVNGEQSSEVLDLRMACLEDRRASMKALTDVLATADKRAVNSAVDAVGALPPLDRCADVRLLRAPIEPPRDAQMRGRSDDLRRRATVAKALHDTGRNQQAVEEGKRLVAEARALGYAPLLAELLALTCAFQESATFDARSVKLWEEAIWTGLRAKRDDLAAEAAAVLSGMVGGYMHRREEGERWADLADALADRLGDGHERLRAWIAQSRAAITESTDPEGALRLTRTALALKRKVLPPDDPDIGHSLLSEVNELHLTGRDAAAVEVAKEADRILIDAYGPSHALVAQSQSNHGECLIALGRSAEALPLLRNAATNWEAQVGPDNPLPAYPLTGLGRALLALGRSAEARAPLERALDLRERNEGDPALLAETRFALARALWPGGERRRAVALATKARQESAQAATGAATVKEVDAWLAAHE